MRRKANLVNAALAIAIGLFAVVSVVLSATGGEEFTVVLTAIALSAATLIAGCVFVGYRGHIRRSVKPALVVTAASLAVLIFRGGHALAVARELRPLARCLRFAGDARSRWRGRPDPRAGGVLRRAQSEIIAPRHRLPLDGTEPVGQHGIRPMPARSRAVQSVVDRPAGRPLAVYLGGLNR